MCGYVLTYCLSPALLRRLYIRVDESPSWISDLRLYALIRHLRRCMYSKGYYCNTLPKVMGYRLILTSSIFTFKGENALGLLSAVTGQPGPFKAAVIIE